MGARPIIRIDEEKCDGCGECIVSCAEGALAIVDGKARLVREIFCDGFGDCVGRCPTGALTIEERPADAYDPEAVRLHVAETRGEEGLRNFEKAEREHRSRAKPAPPSSGLVGLNAPAGGSRSESPAGLPGRGTALRNATGVSGDALPAQAIPSELRQWPVQLHLVQPGTPFFRRRELVVLSTCAPVASADIHWRFLRGRAVVIACPKLDRTEGYVEKLSAILTEPTIERVIVVRMEVPCCGGLNRFVLRALNACGRPESMSTEVVVGVNGDLP